MGGLNLRSIAMPAVSHADGLVTIRLDDQIFAVSADVARAMAAAMTRHADLVEQQAAADDIVTARMLGKGYR